MSLLLYCANDVVLATHDSAQDVPGAAYGSGVSVIPWPSLATLAKVGPAPAPGLPELRPYAAPVLAGAAQLIAYASTRQSLIASGGISVNVGSGGSPQIVAASTDPESLTLLNGAAAIAAASPTNNFEWVPPSGVPVTLTAAQITSMFADVSAFLQGTFVTLSGVITAINAGTITTQAQVDSPPSPIPAWPTNS